MTNLLETWKSFGNEYGTEEGGWLTLQEAKEAIRLVEATGLHVEDDFGIIGRLGEGGGWEPIYPDTKYEAYCLTSTDGEYLLQPGEDDGERTEEGVNSVTPPKGFVWVFVA